jgi:L-lactate dehydrogenase
MMQAATKIGVIGAGAVGTAGIFALLAWNVAEEIVVIDTNTRRATGVVNDLRYATALGIPLQLRTGAYADLSGAAVVVITAGINEKAGGAIDRSDPDGRLRLLSVNAEIYRDIVPRIVSVAPEAVLLVVTDPPDPLADLSLKLAGHSKVISAGTYIDSLRFRFHLAQRLQVAPHALEALVLGEHGTTEVFLWSGVRVGGVALRQFAAKLAAPEEKWRAGVESDVRYANISIIEGTGASQYGIGMVIARICKAIVHNERAVIPVAAHSPEFGVTLSLPSILSRSGVEGSFVPLMDEAERAALERSAQKLRSAVASLGI